jgi:hypothetical protein
MYPQDWQETSVFLPQIVNHWKEVKRMSKMAEMDQTIKELRDAAAAINSAADWLYQQFSGITEEAEPAPEPEAPQAEPEEKELKLEDVRAVLADTVARRVHGADPRAAPQVWCEQAVGCRSEGLRGPAL